MRLLTPWKTHQNIWVLSWGKMRQPTMGPVGKGEARGLGLLKKGNVPMQTEGIPLGLTHLLCLLPSQPLTRQPNCFVPSPPLVRLATPRYGGKPWWHSIREPEQLIWWVLEVTKLLLGAGVSPLVKALLGWVEKERVSPTMPSVNRS